MIRIAAVVASCLLPAFALAAEVKTLSAPEAAEALKQGRIVLVDIRQPEEWRQTGVADGARMIPMRHPEGGRGLVRDLLAAGGGRADAPIALICRTGNRSAATAAALADAGFTNLYDVSEGMAGSKAGPGWIRRGLPVTPCPSC